MQYLIAQHQRRQRRHTRPLQSIRVEIETAQRRVAPVGQYIEQRVNAVDARTQRIVSDVELSQR